MTTSSQSPYSTHMNNKNYDIYTVNAPGDRFTYWGGWATVINITSNGGSKSSQIVEAKPDNASHSIYLTRECYLPLLGEAIPQAWQY